MPSRHHTQIQSVTGCKRTCNGLVMPIISSYTAKCNGEKDLSETTPSPKKKKRSEISTILLGSW